MPYQTFTNLVEITSPEQCAALFSHSPLIIFKHSETCDRSLAALESVLAFCAEHPDAIVHMISVQACRPAARLVTEKTGIPHASPQLLALRNGVVFAHASHLNITPQFLVSLGV